MRGRGPVPGGDRDRGTGEHQVGDDGAARAAADLRGQVGSCLPPGQPAKSGIGEGDDRVEVAAGDRAEHHDDGVQPGRRGSGVFGQLQSGVTGGQALGRDPGADHHGG